MSEYLLEMKDIHKRFPGVYALKGVNLNLKPGEVILEAFIQKTRVKF